MLTLLDSVVDSDIEGGILTFINLNITIKRFLTAAKIIITYLMYIYTQ